MCCARRSARGSWTGNPTPTPTPNPNSNPTPTLTPTPTPTPNPNPTLTFDPDPDQAGAQVLGSRDASRLRARLRTAVSDPRARQARGASHVRRGGAKYAMQGSNPRLSRSNPRQVCYSHAELRLGQLAPLPGCRSGWWRRSVATLRPWSAAPSSSAAGRWSLRWARTSVGKLGSARMAPCRLHQRQRMPRGGT